MENNLKSLFVFFIYLLKKVKFSTKFKKYFIEKEYK